MTDLDANTARISNGKLLALSLFSGAGIGDIGLRAGGCLVLGLSELEEDRVGLARTNFPEAKIFQGDIWSLTDKIVEYVSEELRSRHGELDVVSCTAPCQGMSKNGQGTLLKNIREGKRPKLDPRNRLILPALRIMAKLRPRICIFENVTEMRRTYIDDDDGQFRTILDVIAEQLGNEYTGKAYDVEFADYGIPQRRQRLITVYTRDPVIKAAFAHGVPLIPFETHARVPTKGKQRWVSVWETIRDFPRLDASTRESARNASIPFHRVPLLDAMKHFWVANTPAGKSAFDNQCVKCGYEGNPTHSAGRDNQGINRASKETPLYCAKCGEMLPRPSTLVADGSRRIMSGYTSAYKRMAANLPAPALTRNFSYACSDQKVHPFQNRVLSIAEALKIHSLSGYSYEWNVTGEGGSVSEASDGLIRLVIGESIPPKFMELLVEHLQRLSRGDVQSVVDLAVVQATRCGQSDLFAPA